MKYFYLFLILALKTSNLWSQQLTYQTHEMVYDDLNRLTQIKYDSGLVYEYEYDNLGNRLARKTRIELPNDNYGVSVTGLTCIDSNDGEINITADKHNFYNVSINSTQNNYSGNFEINEMNSWDLLIDNLEDGEYILDLTILNIPEAMYKETYILNISEPEPLQATSSVQGTSINTINGVTTADIIVDIPTGTAPYIIEINGVQVLETNDSSPVVNVANGDLLTVRTSKSCEGIIEKTIDIPIGVALYPNPTDGIITITLSPPSENQNTQLIQVYDLSGRLVLERSEIINSDVTIDISKLSTGEYFVVIPSISETTFKVIKR